ncbi:MAG: FAD-dependent oxidoreductase [Planctomycetia bacterium]|nr:FAD-dependent oxidoreductase [Planctomycetia bacterium]
MSKNQVTRRELLKLLGMSTVATSLAGGLHVRQAQADMVETKNAKRGHLYDGSEAAPCRLDANGNIVRPETLVPEVQTTDVLVLGGGTAGCAAAIAAARAGVKVTLVERYNHFGGLATGGLVLIILGHWTEGKKIQVCQGIGEEMMARLEKLPYGIVNRKPGANPTIDAEAYKYLLVEMLTEAGVDIWLHSLATDAIVSDNTVRGVVFQTKTGPQAILAKQTIDTTGDGDIFASAGAAYDRRDYHIGLPARIGDVPKMQPGQKRPRNYGDLTPIDDIRWLNMRGKTTDGLDAKNLSNLELEYRKKIWQNYITLREQEGFGDVKMIETAPQLGVRITRVLKGVVELTREGAENNVKFDDCVGLGGAWFGDHQAWQLPLRALLPEKIDNLLTAGRSISTDPRMSDLIRVIPNCWVSGQGAGCAAAAAVLQDVLVRNVDYSKLRQILVDQNVYLG